MHGHPAERWSQSGQLSTCLPEEGTKRVVWTTAPRNDNWDERGVAVAMTAPGRPPAALPPNWHAANRACGQGYYFNELTPETSWTDPILRRSQNPILPHRSHLVPPRPHHSQLVPRLHCSRFRPPHCHDCSSPRAAPNVPVASNPHFSCDGVDGRPTAQLSFKASD